MRKLLLVVSLLWLVVGYTASADNLVMLNGRMIADWGSLVQINGTLVTTEGDRGTPNITEIECQRTYQRWQDKEGPECHEISAGLVPAGPDGSFALDITHTYYSVQTWDDKQLVAIGTAGVCDVGYVIRVRFGEAKDMSSKKYPHYFENAVVTKSKIGSTSDNAVCKGVSTYTMTLMSGADALTSKRLWWPLK